ncbi:Wadjet anti-phage system protein JetD domain-containing protein [Marinimicrobium sp. ARAG 43.8]|uniref:Wadjet anti-phage system protein JetD domain-containing protein n=1 Tax=Marinimicrobium sp. ARAG 43.8 TaxID=3418719 RepID=UPI003CF0336E
MSRPVWLNDEPWLATWLGWFLDRLDEKEGHQRERAITRRVKKSTLPALYEFAEDTGDRWQLLNDLAVKHSLFTIVPDPRLAPFHEPYENAQFRLNPDCEPLLRDWLNRPRQDPLTLAWEQAIGKHRDSFIDQGKSLLTQRPTIAGLSPEHITTAFAGIKHYLEQNLTLREIAARCFDGNSKALDSRQDLLIKLFGEQANSIQARPLLLTAWAPPGFTRLLIVENQDSFLRLTEQPPEGYALLYSGGFRASATRLGSVHTRFAFLPGSGPEYFRQHWLSEALPCYFWGDLDFAGMGILKALRNSLPNLRAWQPGYAPMLNILQSGGGHTPEQAGKTGQSDPGQTACAYSDSTLLPALRRQRRSLDQEAIIPENCTSAS